MPWLAILLGRTLFGVGMALVGTCGFGSLIRLGAGDLRSLIVMIVFGAAAYATLRGMLAPLRIDGLEPIAVAVPGAVQGDLPSVLAWLGLGDLRLAIALVAAAVLLLLAVALDRRLRRSPRLLLAGLTLGLGVVARLVGDRGGGRRVRRQPPGPEPDLRLAGRPRALCGADDARKACSISASAR